MLTKEYQDPAEDHHEPWFIIIQLIPGLHDIYQQTKDINIESMRAAGDLLAFLRLKMQSQQYSN